MKCRPGLCVNSFDPGISRCERGPAETWVGSHVQKLASQAGKFPGHMSESGIKEFPANMYSYFSVISI